MDFAATFAISAAGMEVEQMRFNVAALNLANAHSARGVDGSMYQPMRLISGPKAGTGFQQVMDRVSGMQSLSQQFAPQVRSMEPMNTPPRMVFDPGHPEADDRGFVGYPAVNTMLEMLSLTTALRAYEANVVAINAAKSMAMKSMEIGGST
jgi:flagellar basal-body rod protein FlgC